MPTFRPLRRRGDFTMIELLIAMTMVLAVTGAAWSLFRSQGSSLRANTDRYDLLQNARNAIELGERTIRTMGAGVVGEQPMLVYGADRVLAFNTDYVERDTVDMRWAAYWNPDAPLAETQAWDVAQATTIPASSPGYSYPATTFRLGNGAPSPAETYILWFALDTDTPRGDDWILWQRVNNGTSEILARNILPHPNGRPFFEYLMHRTLVTGDTLITAAGTLLPLIRRPLVAGLSAADSASYVRPDSVRAVRMHLRIGNGRSGAEERFRDVSTTIEVPNNGLPTPTVCGRAPIAPGGFVATDTIPGSGRVWLSWSASTDQASGEQDVRQYVVWRRLASQPIWAEPLLIVRSESGATDYTSEISGNTPGTAYVFGVAAQDCTPTFSSITTAAITTSVAP
jgi:hypothetical protein